jgi:hypothetical protein
MSDDDDDKKPVMNTDFMDEIRSNDHRRQLVAMRDLMAQELDGNRCRSCQMLQMRSGEIAALVLRLQKVIEELKALPVANPDGSQSMSRLDEIRARRGTKSDPRRQGGRRTGN